MSTATATATKQPAAQAMIQGHLFNPETDTKYAKSKINASGGKSVGIYNSQTGQSLFVGTPLLMTWGLQQYTDDKTGKVSYEMALQFPDDDRATDETRAFLKSMADFETKLKADALANSKHWFANGKFGITWRFVQGMIQPRLSMRGKCHLSLSSSESSVESIQNDRHVDVVHEQQQQKQSQFTTETVDSDDDGDHEEEEDDDSVPSRTPSVPVVPVAVAAAAVEAPKKKIIKKVGA